MSKFTEWLPVIILNAVIVSGTMMSVTCTHLNLTNQRAEVYKTAYEDLYKNTESQNQLIKKMVKKMNLN